MPLDYVHGRPELADAPLTLRRDSARCTPVRTPKVTYSALRVEPLNRSSLTVALYRPWTVVEHAAGEPTLEDFLAEFCPRWFGPADRVARYDGKRLTFDEPMAPRKRHALAVLMSQAHSSVLAAHRSGAPWPIPSAGWTGWLTASEDPR